MLVCLEFGAPFYCFCCHSVAACCFASFFPLHEWYFPQFYFLRLFCNVLFLCVTDNDKLRSDGENTFFSAKSHRFISLISQRNRTVTTAQDMMGAHHSIKRWGRARLSGARRIQCISVLYTLLSLSFSFSVHVLDLWLEMDESTQ